VDPAALVVDGDQQWQGRIEAVDRAGQLAEPSRVRGVSTKEDDPAERCVGVQATGLGVEGRAGKAREEQTCDRGAERGHWGS
jgi:hypothetical protein